MTTEELNTIVQAVIDKINNQVIDFDVVSSTPENTDLLSAVRPKGNGTYQGVTLKWDDVANAVTREAKGYRDEAASAKTNVENMKASVDQTVSDFNTLAEQKKAEVQGVYQTDLNELKGDLNAESTARQTADNTLQQNIDSEALTRAEADTALGARIDLEVTTRESEVAELERVNAIQKYEIENLKAKAEGQIYREEIIEANAYKLDVPSSVSPYAEVQKIGGKSVVWNQLASPKGDNSINGISVTFDGYKISIKGTAIKSGGRLGEIFNRIPIYNGHIYFVKAPHIDGFWYLSMSSGTEVSSFGNKNDYSLFTVSSDGNVILGFNVLKDNTYDIEGYVYLIDLTLMFGSGKEPTLEECKKIFSADYYPYDAGTIKSFPVKTVKSVGRNLINLTYKRTNNGISYISNGSEIKIIGTSTENSYYHISGFSYTQWKNLGVAVEVEAGTYYFSHEGSVNTEVYCYGIYEDGSDVSGGSISTGTKTFERKGLLIVQIAVGKGKTCNETIKVQIEKGSVATDYVPYREPVMLDVSSVTSALKSAGSAHDEWNNGKKIKRVGERAYTSGDESESNYITDGTTTYYPLDTPTESQAEIDNFIQVEGGGTLTFESDDAVHMPVPSTERFVVDLS